MLLDVLLFVRQILTPLTGWYYVAGVVVSGPACFGIASGSALTTGGFELVTSFGVQAGKGYQGLHGVKHWLHGLNIIHIYTMKIP